MKNEILSDLINHITETCEIYQKHFGNHTPGIDAIKDIQESEEASYIEGLMIALGILENSIQNTPRFQLVDIDGNVGSN